MYFLIRELAQEHCFAPKRPDFSGWKKIGLISILGPAVASLRLKGAQNTKNDPLLYYGRLAGF